MENRTARNNYFVVIILQTRSEGTSTMSGYNEALYPLLSIIIIILFLVLPGSTASLTKCQKTIDMIFVEPMMDNNSQYLCHHLCMTSEA